MSRRGVLGSIVNTVFNLRRTLNDILALTEDLRSRKWHEKVLRKMDDATAVKTLDGQLTQAFRIFEVSRNVIHSI